MTKRKLPPAKSWRERDIADWNVATFHSYLTERHTELYGLPYVPFRGWRAEQGMLKRAIDELGPETLRTFIDRCFAEYRPTREFPCVNYGWMQTYMKSRWLPIVMTEIKRKEAEMRAVENVPSADEIAEWL